jgi:ParB family transcriptional regulator, chromosome partitioning protein
MLDQMARGDMPGEQQFRVIAAASDEEQTEVWKKRKPKKGQPTVSWAEVARALSKTRMYARDASFDDDRRTASSGRRTCSRRPTRTAAIPSMLKHSSKRSTSGWRTICPSAARSSRSTTGVSPSCRRRPSAFTESPANRTAPAFISIATVRCRPSPTGCPSRNAGSSDESGVVVAKPRLDVTRKGQEMVGDMRTDALHEALARAPVEDDTLLALLVLAFAGQNVSVASGNAGGHAKFATHAARPDWG